MARGELIAALIAVLIGVFCFSSIPTKLGFYRELANYVAYPAMIGYIPAFNYGVPWKYTFEELYKSDLTGQKAIVTGANSGIGYEISLALARQGAKVTMACRNPTKCGNAAERIRADGSVKGEVKTMTIDTSSLSSVKAFAETYLKASQEDKSLDMLFLNAGVVFPFANLKCIPKSEDGIEQVFATNYVGHHLLYRLLEPMLKLSKVARVVQTSSTSSFMTYSYKVATDIETLNGCSESYASLLSVVNKSYDQSKLAQIVWAKALMKRLGPDSTIYANAFHPGLVNTAAFDKEIENLRTPQTIRPIVEWFRSEVVWTPAEGSLTGLFLGVAVDRLVKDDIRGRYFHPQAQEVTNPMAEDERLQDDLWKFSDELVKDFLPTEKPPEEKEETLEQFLQNRKKSTPERTREEALKQLLLNKKASDLSRNPKSILDLLDLVDSQKKKSP
jgi:retinol dehydrogenase-14